MIKNYKISICHRLPNNGMPSGRIEAFEIGENKFYAKMDRGVGFRYDTKKPGIAWIGNKTINILAVEEMVGNWCWDEIYVDKEDLKSFLMKVWDRFGIEEGTEEVSNYWDSGNDFNTEFFIGILEGKKQYAVQHRNYQNGRFEC